MPRENKQGWLFRTYFCPRKVVSFRVLAELLFWSLWGKLRGDQVFLRTKENKVLSTETKSCES